MDRLSHVLMGCFQAGAWLVLSVSAYYLLKKKNVEFAKASMKIALIIAALSSVLQLTTGHTSAIGVSKNQPVKFAAFEGHYEEYKPVPFHIFGWVDEEKEAVRFSIGVPGFISFLVQGDFTYPVRGLRSFPKDVWPPVHITFQSYHAMILIGIGLMTLSIYGLFLWWRGRLFHTRWILRLFVVAVLGPQAANQLGWMAAEVGRQPWIVYDLLRTSEGVSKTVSANEVFFSLLMFHLTR